MIFSNNVGLTMVRHSVMRLRREVPFENLLEGCKAAGFSPGRSRQVFERAFARSGLLDKYVDQSQFKEGGLLFKPRVLFPKQSSKWRMICGEHHDAGRRSHASGGAHYIDFDIETSDLGPLASVLRRSLTSRDATPFTDMLGGADVARVRGIISARGSSRPIWPKAVTPGIYRREHASVLIRSRTTSILVDPIGMNGNLELSILRSPLADESIDAIAITHGHGDHWHLPTILKYATEFVPVLVPHVPTPSLLTAETFAEAIRAVGLNPLERPWGATVRVGDIEIDVLPFFGEQPTREAPGPEPLLRNWGNCYRFNTEDYSAILLSDSGADPLGSMLDAIAQSIAMRGPADVVLSCLREFTCPFFGGLVDYWATLPFGRVRQLYEALLAGVLPYVTAGVEGVADICEAASARYFLPYAHGFQRECQPITDVGLGERSEAESLRRVAAALAARRAATRAEAWNVGDCASFRSGAMRVGPTSHVAKSIGWVQ